MANWLSVRLRTKWFCVRVQLQSLKLQISSTKKLLFWKFWSVFWPKNRHHHHQETFTSLCYMLFKIWNMYMDDIMNITVYNSAYIWVYLLNVTLWIIHKAKLEILIRNAHIKSINFWMSMVSFNQHLLRKVWILRI